MRKPDQPPEKGGKDSDVSDHLRCCHCGAATQRSGWCEGCQKWPANITPGRTDFLGHRTDTDGFCWECKDFRLSKLEHTPQGWADTRTVQTLVLVEESRRRIAALLRALGERMSLRRMVPVNLHYAPAWWRKDYVVVGTTDAGDPVILPTVERSPTGAGVDLLTWEEKKAAYREAVAKKQAQKPVTQQQAELQAWAAQHEA